MGVQFGKGSVRDLLKHMSVKSSSAATCGLDILLEPSRLFLEATKDCRFESVEAQADIECWKQLWVGNAGRQHVIAFRIEEGGGQSYYRAKPS